MVIRKKNINTLVILSAAFLLFCGFAYLGSRYPSIGNPLATAEFKGGVVVDSALELPIYSTSSFYYNSGVDSSRLVCASLSDTTMQYYYRAKWYHVFTMYDTTSILATKFYTSVHGVPSVTAASGYTVTLGSNSTDRFGNLSITTSGSPTVSVNCFTLAFGNSYSVTPSFALMSPSDVHLTTLFVMPIASVTATQAIGVTGSNTLSPSTTYKYVYQVNSPR